jgi:glyceraldehyde 3-phosphate dehydrogenase
MSKKITVGINGFGRIGRAFMHAAKNYPEIEVKGVNDLGDIENLAYLLKYDSVYGHSSATVDFDESHLIVDDVKIPVSKEKDPSMIPWGTWGVDVVVECTGAFTEYAKAAAHLKGGAKHVVISAPAKSSKDAVAVEGITALVGVNEDDIAQFKVTSNASCTTNCISPVVAILDAAVGIDLNTTHAYTATQMIVDGPGGKADLRRGRAAALNIVPSSTGAAKALGEVHKQMQGKFDGIALRIPVPAGSMADVTFIAKRDTTAEEINNILRAAAKEERWQGIFTASDEMLVSSDIVGDHHASIADLSMTRVIGNLVKVLAWYDNEMGYTHTLVRHVKKAGESL